MQAKHIGIFLDRALDVPFAGLGRNEHVRAHVRDVRQRERESREMKLPI